MKPSFAPLALDAIEFLSTETDIDFGFCDFTDPRWLCATKRRDDGTLMGVAVMEMKTWFDAYFTVAIADPAFMTPKLIRAIFGATFQRAVRITAEIDPDNERAISAARRLGFVYEGFKRLGVEGKRDAYMFGMLKDDCRFLPGVRAQPVPSVFPLGERRHGLHS